jgi:hypothetical protein
MNSLSSLKEAMDIVGYHSSMSKTSLLGGGLVISGPIIRQTNFDLIERRFWTELGSLGELTPFQPPLLP